MSPSEELATLLSASCLFQLSASLKNRKTEKAKQGDFGSALPKMPTGINWWAISDGWLCTWCFLDSLEVLLWGQRFFSSSFLFQGQFGNLAPRWMFLGQSQQTMAVATSTGFVPGSFQWWWPLSSSPLLIIEHHAGATFFRDGGFCHFSTKFHLIYCIL